MPKIVIHGGTIVSDKNCHSGQIVIENGKITEILPPDAQLPLDIVECIDAHGLYLFPGFIDAHMHVKAPFQGVKGKLTFYQQSICAAYGGITTFADFSNTYLGDSVIDKVHERITEMSESAIDYFVHGKFVNPSEKVINEIPELINLGVPTFKMFMTYSREKVITDDLTLYKIFKISAQNNCLPMVHAESDAIADWNFDHAQIEKNFTWYNFAKCKPINCELEAFQKAVLMATEADSALLIVHTTNKPCLDYAQQYQKQGHRIYIETCPHYLTLFDDLYETSKGHLAMCSPPLRTPQQAEYLWEGIRSGVISITGSDDCTFTRSEKEQFLETINGELVQDFTKVVNGISGLELRLPILLTEGYHQRNIDLSTICRITSTNIAKIMGLYPQKGTITIGSDADISFVDLDEEWIVSTSTIHNGSDFTLHDGYKAKGRIISTMVRGEFVLKDKIFTGTKGKGQFIKRFYNKKELL